MAGEKKTPFSKAGIKTLARALSPLTAVALVSCASAATPAVQRTAPDSTSGALVRLDRAFQQAYADASVQTMKDLRAEVPLIVNDFLNMTLYLPNRTDSVRFNMDGALYFLMARVSHVPIAIYSGIVPYGYGALGEARLEWIIAYDSLLTAARFEVEGLTNIDQATRDRLLLILTTSLQFNFGLFTAKTVTENEMLAYTRAMLPLIDENLAVGAAQQLDQFRAQMSSWMELWPTERWDELRVVVEGFHQPRALYSQKLFFQWLLREPGLEDKVVYAEYQFSPFRERDEAERLSLQLLTNVYLDKGIAFATLGDSIALQRDVMGPAADSIIQSWGPRNQR